MNHVDVDGQTINQYDTVRQIAQHHLHGDAMRVDRITKEGNVCCEWEDANGRWHRATFLPCELMVVGEAKTSSEA